MTTTIDTLIAGLLLPGADSVLDGRVGQNFNELAMCDYCRSKAAGKEPPALGDNVTSISSRCRQLNGCVVCSFCGVAMFDSLAEYVATRTGASNCTECGGVDVSAASHFMNAIDERVERSRESFVEWDRRVRCLELFGVATGIAVFAARQTDDPLLEDEVERLFHAILGTVRLPETDIYINRFFDKVGEAVDYADRLTTPERPPIRLAPPPAPDDKRRPAELSD